MMLITDNGHGRCRCNVGFSPMVIVGYCHGIRSERRLCEEVSLNLAYRWFAASDLRTKFPIIQHSRRTAVDAFARAICSELYLNGLQPRRYDRRCSEIRIDGLWHVGFLAIVVFVRVLGADGFL